MSVVTTLAVEGCCHGDLDMIYEVLAHSERKDGVKTDFMICCGDFQAIRTAEELETLACPPVYRHMKDFHKYWNGERVPRCLTLFVGGNHEAPGHLREMFFGGFAARDIFYFGSAGVFNVNELRIAGLSGIYKSHDYDKPIFESPPYTENTKRSAYHVRRFELEKLMQIQQPVDIVVSHDWPTGITDFGDTETMLRLKDRTGQLRGEIQTGTLGNPHTMALLKKLKPKYWFAGHMHIKYSAIYTHEDGSVTKFLALDKCVPRRPFLQQLTVDSATGALAPHGERNVPPGQTKVYLDYEWLAILKANNGLMPIAANSSFANRPRAVTQEEIDSVREYIVNSSTVEPRPIVGENGLVEFPFFGQVTEGDERYRQWICGALGMSDRVAENAQLVVPQAPPTESVEAHQGGEDILFFEDNY